MQYIDSGAPQRTRANPNLRMVDGSFCKYISWLKMHCICWAAGEIVLPYNVQINHGLPEASPKLGEQSICLSHPPACPFPFPIGIDGHVNV